MEKHPSAERLIKYLAGKLPEKEQDGIEKHLSRCPVCRIALASIEDKVDNKTIRETREREREVFHRMRMFMFGQVAEEDHEEDE